MKTPRLLVEEEKLMNNILNMYKFSKEQGLNLRPHFKAHKSLEISSRQSQLGVSGFTVSNLGEAEVLLDEGFDDIFVAYQLLGEDKFHKLNELLLKGKVSVAVDSLEGARFLNECGKNNGQTIDYLVEIDTGLKRCGLPPGMDVADFIKLLRDFTHISFKGIFTHAGHVYGASPEEVSLIGRDEGSLMDRTAEIIKETLNHENFVVSVGSTPTVKYSGLYHHVNEIRPGNYVFNDAIQVGLKAAELSECALKVIACVISRPNPERAVIDAGSKTLALDRGAHGHNLVSGFGLLTDQKYPRTITRLSEEHGILSVTSEDPLVPGDLIEIIPNHACTVINLGDEYVLSDKSGQASKYLIEGRGKVS